MLESIQQWLLTIFGPPSKYRADDTVQLNGGNQLMVVISVRYTSRTAPPLVTCQWFDNIEKTIKVGEFLERDLKLYDWYSARENLKCTKT